jgi:hypothetical protein
MAIPSRLWQWPGRLLLLGSVGAVDPLQLLSLRLTVGDLPSERLPDVATGLLVDGHDSPTLREAAGVSPRDTDKARALFRTALGELGCEELTEAESWWRLAKHEARRIVDGDTTPIEGCTQLARIERQLNGNGDLFVFIGYESCWDDDGDKAEYANDIVKAAAELLTLEHPRRWIRLFPRSLGPFFGQYKFVNGSDVWWDLDDEEVPISKGVHEHIRQWAQTVEHDLDQHGSPRFETTARAEQFNEQGNALTADVQDELGPTWVVSFYPAITMPNGVRWEDRGG